MEDKLTILLNQIMEERKAKTLVYETKAKEEISDMLEEIQNNRKKLIELFKPLYDTFGKGKTTNNGISGPGWFIASVKGVSYYYYPQYYNLIENVDGYRDINTNNIRNLEWSAKQELEKPEKDFKYIKRLLTVALEQSRDMMEHAEEAMYVRIKAEIERNQQIGK